MPTHSHLDDKLSWETTVDTAVRNTIRHFASKGNRLSKKERALIRVGAWGLVKTITEEIAAAQKNQPLSVIE
jgi:hypothetical protein